MVRRVKCPLCGSENILYDTTFHIYVCSGCGLVIDDRPMLPDTFKHQGEDYVPRYSGSFTHRVHDHGIGGTEIAGNITHHIREGRTWVARNIDIKVEKHSRKLVKALKELNELAKQLNAPSFVVETAGEILHKIAKEIDANMKESTIRKIVAAAILVAYKACGYPRPIKLLAKEVNLSERDLWEGLRKLKELGTDIRLDVKPGEPCSYISYITAKLKLPPEVGALAAEIITKAKEHPLMSGKSPASTAAAAVYISSILLSSRKNQLEIGETIGQTDVAIRNTYGALVKALDIYVLM